MQQLKSSVSSVEALVPTSLEIRAKDHSDGETLISLKLLVGTSDAGDVDFVINQMGDVDEPTKATL